MGSCPPVDIKLRSPYHFNRHGPKPACQEAEAEAFSILEAVAEALTLFKLEAEAEALVMKPKPKPKPIVPFAKATNFQLPVSLEPFDRF